MRVSWIVRVTIIVLAAVALAVSLYIMMRVDAHRPLPGCGEDGCGDVLNSRWERWGGLSVSMLGVGGYVALILGTAVGLVKPLRALDPAVWCLMVVEGLAGLGFVLWLIGLEWLVIRHFCVFCLSSHVFGVSAYLLVLRRAPVWHAWPRARWALAGSAGIVLAFLIGVHVLVVPDMMAAETADELDFADPSVSDALSGGMMQFGKQVQSRTVKLLNGELTFDLYKVPISGAYDAPHVLLDLSDYCCPSCRNLHGKLKQYGSESDIEMVIVHLPVPMNAACNPNVKRTPSGFKDACAYARFAMAVNKVNASLFEVYHDYLMTGRWPPPVADARAKAEALVGQEAFASALEHEDVGNWINTGIGVQAYIKARTLPRLITASRVISYSGGSKAAFAALMRDALSLGE